LNSNAYSKDNADTYTQRESNSDGDGYTYSDSNCNANTDVYDCADRHTRVNAHGHAQK
jgi:hypothetical protein